MATATTEPIRLPPALRLPKSAQGIAFLAKRHELLAAAGRRYGGAFTLNIPIFGQTVVISDPQLVKDLFSTSRDLLGRTRANLGESLGPGSMFNFDGDELFETTPIRRRRLIANEDWARGRDCALAALAFSGLGLQVAGTIGLVSGNRNVTLAWAAASG